MRNTPIFMAEDFSGLYTEVGRLGKPTLVAWGRQDRTVPFAYSERIAGLLDTELFVVEESGHTPHLERPEVFEPELVKFLRGDRHRRKGAEKVPGELGYHRGLLEVTHG